MTAEGALVIEATKTSGADSFRFPFDLQAVLDRKRFSDLVDKQDFTTPQNRSSEAASTIAKSPSQPHGRDPGRN